MQSFKADSIAYRLLKFGGFQNRGLFSIELLLVVQNFQACGSVPSTSITTEHCPLVSQEAALSFRGLCAHEHTHILSHSHFAFSLFAALTARAAVHRNVSRRYRRGMFPFQWRNFCSHVTIPMDVKIIFLHNFTERQN